MAIQNIILIGASSSALLTWDRRQFIERVAWTSSLPNLGELTARLRDADDGATAILVDIVEEEHLRELTPRLRRSDLQAVVNRRLTRAFARTPYRTASFEGRSPQNPQMERVLLSALTRPDLLRQILAALAAAELPVLGVFSPALLSAPVVRQLDPAAKALVLVTRQRDGSLRHSFYRDSVLAGSRLLRSAVAVEPGDGPGLLRQLEESLRYFDPAFIAGSKNVVEVYLLESPAERASEVHGSEGFRLHNVDLGQLARQLRIKADLRPGEADLLNAELLRRFGPAGNLAPATETRYFRLHRTREFAKIACLVVAGSGLITSTVQAIGLLEARQAREGSAASRQQLEMVLSGRHAFSAATVDPFTMKQVVTAYDALTAHRVAPESVLSAVGQALSQRPRVQLDSLSWTSITRSTDDSGTDTEAEELEAEIAGDTPAPVDSDGPVSNKVFVTLQGRIEPFGGDLGLAFREIEAFRAALAAVPGVTGVTRTAAPLETDPGSTLTGELTSGQDLTEANFALRVVMVRR